MDDACKYVRVEWASSTISNLAFGALIQADMTKRQRILSLQFRVLEITGLSGDAYLKTLLIPVEIGIQHPPFE